MDSIRNVPLYLSIIVTLLVGISGILTDMENRQLYARMAVSLAVFYIIGLYLRHTLVKINKEINKRKELERLKAEAAEKEKQKETENEGSTGRNIDYRAGGDDFVPLDLTKAIKNAILEDTKEK